MKKFKRLERSSLGFILCAAVIISVVYFAGRYTTSAEKVQEMSGSEDQTVTATADEIEEPAAEDEEVLPEKTDEEIRAEIETIVLAWQNSEVTADEAVFYLEGIGIEVRETLAEYVKERREYILLETESRQLLSAAMKYRKDKEFSKTFEILNRIDPAYSQYDRVQHLYQSCEEGVLRVVNAPQSVEDFDACISLLERCGEKHDSPEFEARKQELEEERAAFIDVEEIVSRAESLYDSGMIKESFFSLAMGIEQYPENIRLAKCLVDYRDHYIISVTLQAVALCEEKAYKEALVGVDAAIEEFDCPEFQQLREEIREEKSFLYRLKNDLTKNWNSERAKRSAEEAGTYVLKSGKKLIFGDYTDESVTVLSITGNVAAALAGMDVLFDLRDLSYDVTHWGEEKYCALWLTADVVALLPVIGVIKYLDHIKPLAAGAESASEIVNSVGDIGKAASQGAEAADIVKDAAKIGDDIIEAADVAKDAARTTETAEEIVADIAKEYTPIKTINSKLIASKHDITGVEFGLKKLDYSDGRRIQGVFPKFDSVADVELPKDLYKESRAKHQTHCLEELKRRTTKPFGDLRDKFSAEQLEDIANGKMPEGYVWHHSEEEGLMQLVDEVTHAKTHHDGGYSLWGGDYKEVLEG